MPVWYTILSVVLIILLALLLFYVWATGGFNKTYVLYRNAYYQYKAVLNKRLTYIRYVREVCPDNMVFDGKSTTDVERKVKDFNNLKELLIERDDLVHKYFSQDHFTEKDFFELIKEFNSTTKSEIEPMEEKGELEQTPKPRKTFGSNFTDKQIDILTKCANEATIFAQPISKETMKSIFACNLDTPLQLNNNRLLAYFFNALLMKELIRYDWQDISGENKLFSSKNGNLIKRGDLSTAKNQCLENPPKESEIIDKYINQL